MTLIVQEITMATPDVVRVEILEPPITRGQLTALPADDPGPTTGWETRSGKKGFVYGRPGAYYFREQDTQNTTYLDRAAAVVAGNWGTIGGKTVTNVYLRSTGYDYGDCFGTSGATTVKTLASRHYLYLKLNANLVQGGPYTITFPAAFSLANASFTFNDKTTRACGIRANQVGHRPGDANKLAYFGLWIPGAVNEGAVDIIGTYGLNAFQIIDQNGINVFSGSIVQRISPTQSETGSGMTANSAFNGWAPADQCGYMSTSTAYGSLTALTNANPGVATVSGITLATNDIVRIVQAHETTSADSLHDVNGLAYKVGSWNGVSHTFNLLDPTSGANVDTTAMKIYDPTTIGPARVYKMFQSNRAGTYVFNLDFSAWVPVSGGEFRVYIPGLGVSDPFVVDNAVWFRIAKCYAKGEYHQRSGLACDGRFGYTRPAAFKTGIAGLTIYKSTYPYIWSHYAALGLPNELSSISQANYAPWVTANVQNAFGDWFDAGDWDTGLLRHGTEAWKLLDIWQLLPAAGRAMNFGLPRTTECLDASLYAGTDGLSDLIHSAIWHIDCYRRMQEVDGSVAAGLTYSASNAGDSDQTAHGEPSWLFQSEASTYAPDHLSTFVYAALAAKLAQVLNTAGFTSLASTYQTSAVNAWTFAQGLYTNKTTRDAFYATAKANAGLTTVQYDANDTVIQSVAQESQLLAAASLFRLTGSNTYGDIVKTAWEAAANWQGFTKGMAYWEYSQAAGANATDKANIRAGITARVDNNMDNRGAAQVSYRNLKFRGLSDFYGAGGTDLSDIGYNVVIAHAVSGDSKYLDILQAGIGWILGANQTGQCWSIGLGTRNVKTPLHSDSYARGDALPPSGLTIYASGGNGGPGMLFGFALNFGTGFLNYIVDNPNVAAYGSDFEAERQLTPHRWCLPVYETLFENRFIIMEMEFTTSQNIIPGYYMAAYLHGVDGNTDTVERTHRRLNWNT